MAFVWNKETIEAAIAATPERADFSQPLPVGEYDVSILNVEDKFTQKGGAMLIFTLEITDGPHAKRRIWQRINYLCASEISRAVFGKVVGEGDPTVIFNDKVVRVKTKLGSEFNGQRSAEVSKWMPYGTSTPKAAPVSKASEDTPF